MASLHCGDLNEVFPHSLGHLKAYSPQLVDLAGGSMSLRVGFENSNTRAIPSMLSASSRIL